MKATERALNSLLRCFLEADTAGEEIIPPSQYQPLAEMAISAGLARHLLQVLRSAAAEAPHSQLVRFLEPAYRRNLAATALLRRDSQLLLGTLASAGLICLPFKGIFLSGDLYGDATFRKGGDIDIIVAGGRAGCAAAMAALAPLGYAVPFEDALLRQYYEREYGEIPLVSSGRATADIHYHPPNDLPAGAYEELFARARPSQEGAGRLRLDWLDLLMLLAAHYWTVPAKEHLRHLVDLAVLLKKPGVFSPGWERRVLEWHLGFYVAAATAAIRCEFGLEAMAPLSKSLAAMLSAKQREICRRISEQGRRSVPDGLVQKLHRLSLPLKKRLRLVQKFLWPHPGRIVREAGGKPPSLWRRLRFAFKRLRQALPLR